jgi:hypothetical protein
MDNDILEYLLSTGQISQQDVQVARARAQAEALRGGMQGNQGRTAGGFVVPNGRTGRVAMLASALGSAYMDNKANKMQDAQRAARKSALDKLIQSRQTDKRPYLKTPGYVPDDEERWGY